MPHRFHRHKLLLDENFPLPSRPIRLNSHFDLKHVVKDFKKSGAKDEEVFALAARQKRLLVTFNDKHFYKVAKGNKNTGIIGVSTNLSTEQIDKKLASLLVKSGPKALYNNFNYISGEKSDKKEKKAIRN